MSGFGRIGQRFFTVLSGIAILVGVTACGAAGDGGGGDIVVGVNTEITGANADGGAFAKNAVTMAADEINAKGGVNGKKIKLVIEDSQSTNQGAVASTNKIIDQDKAIAMIGPVKSTQIQALNDIVAKAGLPTLIGGTNCQLTQVGNKWLTRYRPDDCITGKGIAQFAVDDLAGKKISVLHDTDAFGTGGKDQVVAYLKDKGMTPADIEGYKTASENYQSVLQKIKDAGTDVLVIYTTNGTDCAKMMQQVKQLGFTFKIVTSPTGAAQNTLDLAKESAEGVYSATDFVPGSNDQTTAYATAYRKKYNGEPDILTAWNYDALYILAQAMKTAGTTTDKAKIQDTLRATKGYNGVLGAFNMDMNGNGLHIAALVQIKGGKLALVKQVQVQA